MDTLEKLKILTDAAKYDASCSSSSSNRKNKGKGLGKAHMSGICHSWSEDGRCISLLKILLTNVCIYDCEYCINRASNDVRRVAFTPREVADLTINFYNRGPFFIFRSYQKPQLHHGAYDKNCRDTEK